jgi:small subunit ribosomal protein S15
MARIHSRTKGKSGSLRPVNADLSFVDLKVKDVEKIILDLAKEDYSLSKIGLFLRDTHGVPSVKKFTGKSISKILEENKLARDLPEDLSSLVLKATKLKKHLELNSRDVHNKRSLILMESKIRRLIKYYKSKNRLPQNWSYQ